MYVTKKISNSSKNEWEKRLGIEYEEFIFTTVLVEAGRGVSWMYGRSIFSSVIGGMWMVGKGGGEDWLQNPSLLSCSPPYTYLFSIHHFDLEKAELQDVGISFTGVAQSDR
jgi:hypothetical protein